MRTLTVELGRRAYPIHIGEGLLTDNALFDALSGRKVKVLTDANVAPHYLASLLQQLQLSSADALTLTAGEEQKSWTNAERVLDWMLESRLARDACLVALGGGVIGDLAGFCAAIYQRGIDFVQIPTTLLAQVDSSVGGKTGINHARGKNMIGAFHQPRMVLADTSTLKTLPARELRAGVAEVIKYGMLADNDFFLWLETNLDKLLALDSETLAYTVHRCCELKAKIVAQDEREALGGGPRALLNLGHSFGHAIETYTGYGQWLHGEAVATGLCMAADLSARLGWLPQADAERCISLIQRAGLPVQTPTGMRPEHFVSLMAHDKKVAAGKLRLVLMRKIGTAVLSSNFDPKALDQTLKHFACN